MYGQISGQGSFKRSYDTPWNIEHQAKLKSKCQVMHPEQLLSCEKFSVHERVVYAACAIDMTVRKKTWFLQDKSLQPTGKLWKWELDVWI